MTETTIVDDRIPHRGLELKIKRNSLAAESRIIKNFEGALRNRILRRLARTLPVDQIRDQRAEIYGHRIAVVRTEARAAHLAASYLRRTPYAAVEDPLHTRSHPNWNRVQEIVKSFSSLGDNAIVAGMKDWIKAAEWDALYYEAHRARVGTRQAKAADHRAARAVAAAKE